MPFSPLREKYARIALRKKLRKLEGFKALCSIVPQNLEEAEQICACIDTFERDHPELEPKISEFYDKKEREALDSLAHEFESNLEVQRLLSELKKES